jgi:hypothetical protein
MTAWRRPVECLSGKAASPSVRLEVFGHPVPGFNSRRQLLVVWIVVEHVVADDGHHQRQRRQVGRVGCGAR